MICGYYIKHYLNAARFKTSILTVYKFCSQRTAIFV